MANITTIGYRDATGRLKEIYDLLIQKRGKLAEVHTVQSLHPESILSHMQLYLDIMFSKSPLSRAQREMIAVVVSAENGCAYCQEHHSAALNQYWKDTGKIARLRQDYLTAGLDASDQALCRLAIDLTLNPGSFGDCNSSGFKPLRAAGLEDRAILDATLTISYFNFVNRMVLALHVELEEDAGEGFHY